MEAVNESIDQLAKTLWNYHRLNQELEKSDAIFVLGNHDLRSADYGISLFKQGWAPLIIFSGGVIHQNSKLNVYWNAPEAEIFAHQAIKQGIPSEKILVESRAKNTGENFEFTAELLNQKALNLNKFVVVQKPYMERRTFATGIKHWPDKRLIVTSPTTSYENYVNGDIPKDRIISFMVGDLQRIKVYGETGLQAKQDIPEDVWKAYVDLVDLGFTDRLLKE